MSDDAAHNGAIQTARETVRRLFAAALHAVDPALAVRRALRLRRHVLHVGDANIDASGGIFIVAVGKAAVRMTKGALAALDASVIAGHVITKEGHAESALPETIAVYEAGHPIPDARGVEATRTLLDRLATLDDGVVVLALISGGGSALLEAPQAGISIEDFATMTNHLLRAGAPIEALNAVRTPLSRVKAGGLRAAAPRATWVTLILSDVLGNDPRVIASGPTVPSEADPVAVLSIIERYGVRERLPEAILTALHDASPEHEPVADEHDVLLVIGDNAAAVQAAAAEAREAGLVVHVILPAIEGEAAEIGRAFVGEIARAPEWIDVLLGGGETTVTVRGDGKGGRNTEFALAAAQEMERRGMSDWVVASLATDGQDAMTGLAGAIADAETCRRARDSGVDPDAALARSDSAAVFEAAGGAVNTGPTGTNVNDLYIAVRTRDAEIEHVQGGG